MNAKVNRIKTLHHGRVFKLVSENVTLSNGVQTDMDIIRHPGAAAIVPMLSNQELMMIKQYRHAIGKYIWEIPAGTLNQNESPIACAKREIVEEIGYSANEWEKLGEIIPVPGYSDERIHVFLATDLHPSKQNLDDDEVLEVVSVKFNDAMGMIYDGQIQDSKTITSLFLTSRTLDM